RRACSSTRIGTVVSGSPFSARIAMSSAIVISPSWTPWKRCYQASVCSRDDSHQRCLCANVPVKPNNAAHVERSREVPIRLLHHALLGSRFNQPNNVLTRVEFAFTGELGNPAQRVTFDDVL